MSFVAWQYNNNIIIIPLGMIGYHHNTEGGVNAGMWKETFFQ